MGRGGPCHSNAMSWILPQWMDESIKQNMMDDDWRKPLLCHKMKIDSNSKDT